MNTAAIRTIPFILQAVGYVAGAFLVEEHVEASHYAASTYSPCSCSANDQAVFVAAFDETAVRPTRRKKTGKNVLKYPIGIVSDELEKMGVR